MFRRKRVLEVKQHDITDCGAACLRSIAAYHDIHLSVAKLRQLASTDRRGTNVLGLLNAATTLGFTAKGVRGPFESLFKVPRPCIAHIRRGTLDHFVVVTDATAREIRVMDPADGKLTNLTHDDFKGQWSGVLVLLVPSPELRPTGDRGSTPLRRFWTLVQPHRTVLIESLVGAIVVTLLGLSTSIYVQKIVDFVLVDGNRRLLNLMSVVMIAIIVAQLVIGALRNVLVLRTAQSIDARLILGYYAHLMHLPQRFFDTMRSGEILSRMGDAVKIRAFINDVAVDLTVNVFVLIFALAFMFLYSWKLALLMSLMVPAYAALFVVVNRLNKRFQRRIMERSAELESQLVESLATIRTVKRFALEESTSLKTEMRFVTLLETMYTASLAAIGTGAAGQAIGRTFNLALLWIGAGYVIDRAMTPGELMSCYTLLGYLSGPISSLVTSNRTVQDALIAADRLFEIFDLDVELDDPQMADLPASEIGDIAFENVTFRYGTRGTVLDGCSLRIRAGELTAIVGESGSGKSTLMALVQRNYVAESGRVTIGGLDVRYIRAASLRRRIAVVPQQVELFAGSIAENIAIGDMEPDMRRVSAICDQLGITQIANRFPEGLRTALVENGSNLSGGERQRIAIARALYREPAMLLLDEATSSLDSVSEHFVRAAIDALRAQGTTVVIIAHRLSSIVTADRILFVQKGKVTAEGIHSELLSQHADYAALWRLQSG